MLLARFIQCWCNIDSEAFPMSAQCHGGAIWVERLFQCECSFGREALSVHTHNVLPMFTPCSCNVAVMVYRLSEQGWLFLCTCDDLHLMNFFFLDIIVLAQNDDTPSECHKSFCNTVMYVTDCCNSPSNGHYFVRAFPHRFKYWAKSSEGTKFTLRTTFLHHTTIFNVDGKQARNEQLVMKWTFCSAFLQKFASPQLSRKGKTSQVCIRSILY